ncbi:MAG: hypothetical protein ACLQU2_13295 [Candidatus Binataceae bacterium]
MDNPSKLVWKSPTTATAQQYECEVTCSLPGCTQSEVAIFDETSVELLEAGRFYRRCKNHLTD